MLLSELDIKVNTDDIYNLSLRRSALRLCADILQSLSLLEKLYMCAAGSTVYNRYLSFVRQNRQIALIIEKFNRVLCRRDTKIDCTPQPTHDIKKGGIKPRSIKTLIRLISDVLTLSSITENGFMLNKFMLSCNALSKQLLFLYEN